MKEKTPGFPANIEGKPNPWQAMAESRIAKMPRRHEKREYNAKLNDCFDCYTDGIRCINDGPNHEIIGLHDRILIDREAGRISQCVIYQLNRKR